MKIQTPLQTSSASSSASSRTLLAAAALAVLALAGCATTNDSGVPLHPKPDLSAIAPGIPVDPIAALKKPERNKGHWDNERLERKLG